MQPLRIYEYLLKSRAMVLEGVRALTPEQYRREFPFGLKTIAATLTHTMISEWYYLQRLTGQTVPPYEQWPIKEESPPPRETLDSHWSRQSTTVRAAIAGEPDWSRLITWLSFPDDRGNRFHITASAGDFLTQLAFHEVHHRAQVLVMLRELGHPVQDLDFNALMFDRKPAG